MSLFCRTQNKDILKKVCNQAVWGTIDFNSRKKNTMEVNGAPELLCFSHSSEYLPLCSAEQRHSYRFGTTWGWVNDDTIFIFGWTIPLIQHYLKTGLGQKNWPFSKHLLVWQWWRSELRTLRNGRPSAPRCLNWPLWSTLGPPEQTLRARTQRLGVIQDISLLFR